MIAFFIHINLWIRFLKRMRMERISFFDSALVLEKFMMLTVEKKLVLRP